MSNVVLSTRGDFACGNSCPLAVGRSDRISLLENGGSSMSTSWHTQKNHEFHREQVRMVYVVLDYDASVESYSTNSSICHYLLNPLGPGAYGVPTCYY